MSSLSYLLESVAPMTTQRVVSPWSGTFLVSWDSPFILGWRGAGPTLVASRGESPGPVPGASPGASRGRFTPWAARKVVAAVFLGPEGRRAQ